MQGSRGVKKLKGQINLEFISAAVIYIIALFGLITVGSNVLPGFTSNIDDASLNMEAYHISNQVLTQAGHSAANGGTEDWHQNPTTLNQITSFGLSDSSDTLLHLDRDKLRKIRSYPRDQPAEYFNYSQFKDVVNAEHQYLFNFTWTPIIYTHQSYHRENLADARHGLARYRLERENGLVEEIWNDYEGETESHSGIDGPERGVTGVQNTDAFRFDNSDRDYIISQNQVLIPEKYSIFTWVKGEQSEQDDTWIYAGGFDRRAGLVMQQTDGSPRVGVTVRNEDDDGWNGVWYLGENILDDEWHHIGATVDRNTGTVQIYIDGELVKEGSMPDHWEGSRNIILGSFDDRADTQHAFHGKLDEFRIYEKALSKEEVEDLYYEQLTPYIVPPNTDYYRSSENIVRYGNETLNNRDYKFLVTAHNGVYNTTYVSEEWDFSSASPLGADDSFTLYGDKTFRIAKIQQETPDPGSTIVLNQHLKTFGPDIDSDTTVIRMDRYGIMESEPVRVEVLAW